MIDWPESVTVKNGVKDHFPEIADSVLHGDGAYPREHGFELMGTGDSRLIYDISDVCDLSAVLKVAHNDVGIRENRREVYDREQWDDELRHRLVPVLDYGHGEEWTISPLVSTSIRHEDMSRAQAELRELVEAAGGDPREVYPPNIGVRDGTYVLLDFGGL